MVMGSRWALKIFLGWGIPPEPLYKVVLYTQPTTIKIFRCFAQMISYLAYKCIMPAQHFALTKAIVLLPPLTHFSPSSTEVFPRTPCLKKLENIQQLLIFIQQKTAEDNARIKELKKYH